MYITILLFVVVRLRNPRAFQRGLRNGFILHRRRGDILFSRPDNIITTTEYVPKILMGNIIREVRKLTTVQ